MGVASRYSQGLPPPVPPGDASRRLAEALLGAEMHKSPTRLTIKFDAPADATRAHKVLAGLQESYRAPRK